jgi:hypothetical protein
MSDKRGGRVSYLTHVSVDDAQTLAQANTAIAAVATAIAGVSDAGIIDGSFTLFNKAVATAPADDAIVGAGAVFDFENGSDATIYGNYVPSFLDTLIIPGGKIDITAGAAQTWANFMLAGILGGHMTNPAFVVNSAALDAFLSNRKRRRRVR